MLEHRRMLSTLNWVNKFSDGFDATYGANAATARSIVERAIADWGTVIDNFNYQGGGNTFDVTISAVAFGTSGLVGNTGITGVNAQGKPTSANVELDDDAAGGQWYFDPNVGTFTNPDDSEFDSIISPFSAERTVNPNGGYDFYFVVLHELGHAMGILTGTVIDGNALAIDSFLTDIGEDPKDSGARLFSFNVGGGPVEATFTNSGGLHLYEDTDVPSGNPSHPNDVMNSGRTVAAGRTLRRLISDTSARVLRDTYGYSVVMPSTINNMMVNPDYTTGELTISGQVGTVDDVIVLQSTPTIGQLLVSVGTFTEIVSWPQISDITVNAGQGNDIVRVDFNAGRPTFISGFLGLDVIELAPFSRNLNNLTGEIGVFGGSDFDQVLIYDNFKTTPSTFTVSDERLDRPGWGGLQHGGIVEQITLTTGTGADIINVLSTSLDQDVIFHSAGGADTVNIGNGTNGVQSVLGDLQIQNNPNFTLININDAANTTARNIAIDQWDGNFGAIGGLSPAYILWDRSDVNTVNITTGSNADTIQLLRTSEAINFFNTSGQNQRDNLIIGNDVNGMQSITGAVSVGPNAGLTFTDITLKDTANTIGRSAVWTRVAPGGSTTGYIISGLAPAQISYSYQSVIFLSVLGGSGNDAYTFLGLDDDWAQTSIHGGGGFNTLEVDDRSMPWSPTVADIYADSIHRGIGIAVGVQDIYFTNIQSPTYYAKNSTTSIFVYGVSSSIPAGAQLTVFSGSGNDNLTLIPRDNLGSLTVNGNFGYSGGAGTDTLLITDIYYPFALPITYTFQNLFGPGTTNISGLGTGGFGAGNDVESIFVNGGGGNDTFNIDSFKSGSALTVNGGGGDDTLNFGVTNLTSEITNIASFHFNGQGDFDRFRINNSTHPNPFTYTRDNGATTASNTLGAFYSLTDSNVELIEFNGGPQADSFYVNAVASGAQVVVNAGGGLDGLAIGAFSNNVETVLGPIVFYGEAGGGHVAVYDSADTAADTLHLDLTTLGAYSGDNLFGAGGSLEFYDLANFTDSIGLRMFLSSGADTIYAQPLATARVSINANNPTVAPGDVLNLALAGAQNYSVNPTSATAGNVTSTNRQQLDWTGIESGVFIDAVAPSVLAKGYEAAPVSSVYWQFSENVSNSFPLSSLQLYNETTASLVSSSFILGNYNGGTNTASYTFPGYPDGKLPTGHYSGQIGGTLTDLFGNPVAFGTPLEFDVAAPVSGDYDGNDYVDENDFLFWRSHFGEVVPAGTSADGNGNGVIDAADYTVWRDNLGNGTPPGGGAGSASVTSEVTLIPEQPVVAVAPLQTGIVFQSSARQSTMLEVTSVPENSSSNSRGHGFVVDKAITSQGMKKQALRAARSPDADHEAIDLALSLLTRDHVKAHHPGLHEATHVADVDSDPSELVSLPDDAFNGSLRLAWQSRVRA